MITTPVTLITQLEVISLGFQSKDRVYTDSVRPLLITVAEERYIRPRFGNQLYNELFETKYKDYVNAYIKPALAQFVRSAMIEELAISINDDGVKIFYSNSDDTNSQEQSLQSTQSDVAQNSSSTDTVQNVSEDYEHNNTKTTDSQDQTSFIPLDNYQSDEATSSATTIDRQEIEDQTRDVDTDTTIEKLFAENSSLSRSVNSSKEENYVKSQKAVRAADFLERRVLISQSFNDANTLLGRAVRFVEEHPEEFPSYNPKKAIFKRFF